MISQLKFQLLILTQFWIYVVHSMIFEKQNKQMSNKSEDFFLAKVVIIGDSGVGKTNLMTKYCQGIFKESYVATIGVDFKLKDISVRDTKMRLQIWDTAGQERFRNITQAYFKGARGIILAFDLTQANSFVNLAAWARQVDTTANDALVKLLVGTKLDLSSERVVTTEDAQKFAQKNNMQYIEVSARNGINLQQAFQKLAQGIRANRDKDIYDDGLSIVLKQLQQNGKKNCEC